LMQASICANAGRVLLRVPRRGQRAAVDRAVAAYRRLRLAESSPVPRNGGYI
jgi:hypothetical protein